MESDFTYGNPHELVYDCVGEAMHIEERPSVNDSTGPCEDSEGDVYCALYTHKWKRVTATSSRDTTRTV